MSKDFSKITNLGTRHSAALGLSERTDALCLAVSEEHATVSIAYRGDLKIVGDLEDLQDSIEVFLNRLMPNHSKSAFVRFFTENWREKLTAVVVSILLWVFFTGPGVAR